MDVSLVVEYLGKSVSFGLLFISCMTCYLFIVIAPVIYIHFVS